MNQFNDEKLVNCFCRRILFFLSFGCFERKKGREREMQFTCHDVHIYEWIEKWNELDMQSLCCLDVSFDWYKTVWIQRYRVDDVKWSFYVQMINRVMTSLSRISPSNAIDENKCLFPSFGCNNTPKCTLVLSTMKIEIW